MLSSNSLHRLKLSGLIATGLLAVGCGEVLPIDAGVSQFDGGRADTAVDKDSSVWDGSLSPDAGPVDTGPTDIGPIDTGPTDAGPADTGPADTGPILVAVRVRVAGGGRVLSAENSFLCVDDCALMVAQGSSVQLAAEPATHWDFASWSNPSCGGLLCDFVAEADSEITSTFTRTSYPLVVSISGPGAGSVSSQPGALNCQSGSCSSPFESEQSVILTAQPASGAVFQAWSGDCSGATPTCQVDMTGPKNVEALFEQDLVTLTATRLGPGNVTSSPVGINCPGTCAFDVVRGQSVTLSNQPAPGARFVGWSGGCVGTGICIVTMSTDRGITAEFEPIPVPIIVQRSGNAASDGIISGASGQITCPSQCTTTVFAGASVSLTANTSINTSIFSDWANGPCQGQAPTCSFVAAQNQVPIVAIFEENRLTVTTNGPGKVLGSGIDCGTTCTARLAVSTQVLLTAQPTTSEDRFIAWTGACSGGQPTCTLSVNGASSVGATFSVRPPPVTNMQPAARVLGQPNFTARTPNNGGESLATLNQPRFCGTDGNRLWVGDGSNARVLQWNTMPNQVTMQAASVVIGQASATSHSAATSQDRLQIRVGKPHLGPTGLLVVDAVGSRILLWTTPPTAHGSSADLVIGQSNFVSMVRSVSQSRVDQPYALTTSSTELLVVDTFNHRVVIYPSIPSISGYASASVVLGQPDFDTKVVLSPPTASSMSSPYDAHYDSDRDQLFVVDTNNHRVLAWNGLPTTNRPADFVLGQMSFGSSTANAGQASVNEFGMSSPRGVFVTQDSLFVSDAGNSRVMVWTPVPDGSQNGRAADAVLGQPDLVSTGATTNQQRLRGPWGLCGTSTELYVVDTSDNRVLAFTLSP